MVEKKIRLALICSIIITVIGAILWSLYILLILARLMTIFGAVVVAILLIVWLMVVCD